MGKTVSFCQSTDELEAIDAKKIAEFAKAGNADALEVYEICGEKLGRGLSIIIDLLNPDRIVLGSIFTRCEELLRPAMENVLKQETLSTSLNVCRVVPAELGEAIGDLASLAII